MKLSNLKSLDLRKKFFDFFMKHGHEKIVSSSLIPAQDPTILFTNAGMNQFKDVFLGTEKRSYKRAVSIQKCVRAGGKHNDLENVGFTQRHLTFFEMMGNFSFGDYFKKDAIKFAWDFLTKEIGLNPKKLYVSVHLTDQESYDIWHQEMGIPKEKIFKLGESNFWQMGDVGPCGPCTEIFVDRGPSYGCGKKECDLACGCDRFLEVWNNVFMQFNRQADGQDIPLKQTGVDTGMGLERLTLIVQNKDSVFTTDLFDAVFAKIEQLTGYKYVSSNADIQAAFNVIGDHVRSSTFLIADGCAPSNDGRGYVLRKIIRRAALFAQKLTDENIFPQISLALIEDMKSVYPELELHKDRITSVLQSEIERFADNLVRGKKILQDYIAKQGKEKTVDGEHAFMLYDTYGFPLEVTKLIAFEHKFSVDEIGFEKRMEQQRARSGKKMKEAAPVAGSALDGVHSVFTGYESLQEQSKVIALLVDDVSTTAVDVGVTCWLACKKTPFYVACGGQINDQGTVEVAGKSTQILDLKKIGDAILIKIIAPAHLKIGDNVMMQVDQFSRLQTMKNHTATHLLQAALQQIFGKSVKQAGSIVTSDYLRFDYTYHKPLTPEEIKAIENLVNQKIWDNIPVVIKNTTFKQAVSDGVIAFFGDKYNPDNVRAIVVGDFSAELCGGTHVRATGDIGLFKITEEISLAAGQRRMVAITGFKAVQQFQQDFSIVKKICQDFKIKSETVLENVDGLQNKIKDLQKELKSAKQMLLKSQMPEFLTRIEKIGSVSFGYHLFAAQDYAVDDIREFVTTIQKQHSGFYIMLQTDGLKINFIASVDKSLIDQVSLLELKIWLQQHYNLTGGGSTVMIQGSGAAVDIQQLIQGIKTWLQIKKA
ncbi:alanine--tRNA ligase [Candidatus Babeliales bacterium]|nr:alanine--tRNA ligase [Candidatus Babeliales bacterium]